MLTKMLFGACVCIFAAAQSEAATLHVEGKVFVDRGDGFAPAVENVTLNPGNRVRATDGCAEIIYDNGSRTRLCHGQTGVVLVDAPVASSRASLKDKPDCIPEQTGSLRDTPVCEAIEETWPVAAGLVIAAGAGVAALEAKDHPSSP